MNYAPNNDLSKYSNDVIEDVVANTYTKHNSLTLSGAHTYNQDYPPDLSKCYWIIQLHLASWNYVDFTKLPPNLTKLKISDSRIKEFNYSRHLRNLIVLTLTSCRWINRRIDLRLFMSLTKVDVSNNALREFPLLPESITNIKCSDNWIAKIPYFPICVKIINVSNNELRKLPMFPASVTTIHIQHNNITNIPKLKHTKLIYFNCSSNRIKKLVKLPKTLIKLNCANNLLRYLFNIPLNITHLNCANNYITGLHPNLPLNMVEFDISQNELQKRPNVSKLKHLTDANMVEYSNPYLTKPVRRYRNNRRNNHRNNINYYDDINYHNHRTDYGGYDYSINNHNYNHTPYVHIPFGTNNPHVVSITNKEIPDI